MTNSLVLYVFSSSPHPRNEEDPIENQFLKRSTASLNSVLPSPGQVVTQRHKNSVYPSIYPRTTERWIHAFLKHKHEVRPDKSRPEIDFGSPDLFTTSITVTSPTAHSRCGMMVSVIG